MFIRVDDLIDEDEFTYPGEEDGGGLEDVRRVCGCGVEYSLRRCRCWRQ